MSQLFGTRKKKGKKSKGSENNASPSDKTIGITSEKSSTNEGSIDPDYIRSFPELGLDEWLVSKCESIGIVRPTEVQRHCIPPILSGRDVIGCAQTGSGKTAAFALPILHKLSKDPYGPFAVVLTPTRELAFQIDEQFKAFGSSMNVRSCVIVGGMDMLQQSLALQKRPHIIVATPGRLRDHLIRANPPDLSMISFLVFDEADRLLEKTFSKDLAKILKYLPSNGNYQRLFFSATMSEDLKWLEESESSEVFREKPFRHDAMVKMSLVETLRQEYVFFPLQIKTATFLHIIEQCQKEADGDDEDSNDKGRKKFHVESEAGDMEDEEHKRLTGYKNKKGDMTVSSLATCSSIIIFVATCKTAQLLVEILREFSITAVPLHSMMTQARRLASLGKFKSGISKILVCTDVASRGLDIPDVDLVFNYDLPRDPADYVHRVGRTARAGRAGRAISFISQYDIELLQHIEASVEGKKMELLEDVKEENILKRLKDATTATRVAKMHLMDYGFEEKAEKIKARKKLQRERSNEKGTDPSSSKKLKSA